MAESHNYIQARLRLWNIFLPSMKLVGVLVAGCSHLGQVLAGFSTYD